MVRERVEEEESEAKAPTWMGLFSSLMTILLAFFICIFSMGGSSEEDPAKVPEKEKSGPGLFEGDHIPSMVHSSDDEDDPEGDRIPYTDIKSMLEEELGAMHPDLKVMRVRDGLALNIPDALLFDTGSVDLKPAARKLLGRIVPFCRIGKFDIGVEGHADNTPSRSHEFYNWELSLSRAISVAHFLESTGSIDPGRICPVGYGDARPVAPNDTPENRAKNRRVVINFYYQ